MSQGTFSDTLIQLEAFKRIFVFCAKMDFFSKGRTIRKVMGGGGVGDFQSAGIFFYAQCLCRNFFFS